MILFEPSKSRRFSVRIELQAHDSLPGCLPGWQPYRQLLASVKLVTGGMAYRTLLIGAWLNV